MNDDQEEMWRVLSRPNLESLFDRAIKDNKCRRVEEYYTRERPLPWSGPDPYAIWVLSDDDIDWLNDQGWTEIEFVNETNRRGASDCQISVKPNRLTKVERGIKEVKKMKESWITRIKNLYNIR